MRISKQEFGWHQGRRKVAGENVPRKAGSVAQATQWDEQAIAEFVKSVSAHNDPAHNYEHVSNVVANIKHICRSLGREPRVIVAAGYFHDVVARKDGQAYESAVSRSAELAATVLPDYGFTSSEVNAIRSAIVTGSWEHTNKGGTPESPEAFILRDADLLEAAGAHGIARVFTFSGSKNISINWFDFDPHDPPRLSSQGNGPDPSAFHHFCSKLLWLEQFMSSEIALQEMRARRKFMIDFLQHFRRENRWANT